MSRARTTETIMFAPTHSSPEGAACVVATECAVHTVTLPEGSFSAIVHSAPGVGLAMIAILDHDEVEDQIGLLRNAVEDAKRLDAGLPAVGERKPERSVAPMDETRDPVAAALGKLLEKTVGHSGGRTFERQSVLEAMNAAYRSGRFGLSVDVAAAVRQLRDHQQQASEDGSMVTVSRQALDMVIDHLAVDGEHANVRA